MEQKGIFISYQMAEAIELIDNFDLNMPEAKKKAEEALEKLKAKWLDDTIPGTKIRIGDKFAGMQDLTIEDVVETTKIAKEAETYTLENAGAFQYILIRNENGGFDFDFEKMDKIAELARKNNKKLIVDSAVVFGDHYPDKLNGLSKTTISRLIGEYTRKLVARYGDVLERIDVLNSVFQRGLVSAGNHAEDFWIETFGEDYGKQIIDIVRNNIDFEHHDIKLGWNEFYLTKSNFQQRKDNFLETIAAIDGLGIVGVQDRFVTGEEIKDILEVLSEISKVSKESGKEVCITEFSCSVSGEDLRKGNINEINLKIRAILEAVKAYCESDDNIKRIEGRMSDKFDFNYKELKDDGFDISTTGRTTIAPIESGYVEEVPQPFDSMSREEYEEYQQIQAQNQAIKQQKSQQKQLENPQVKKLTFPNNNSSSNSGFADSIILILIVGCICCALFSIVNLIVGR